MGPHERATRPGHCGTHKLWIKGSKEVGEIFNGQLGIAKDGPQ